MSAPVKFRRFVKLACAFKCNLHFIEYTSNTMPRTKTATKVSKKTSTRKTKTPKASKAKVNAAAAPASAPAPAAVPAAAVPAPVESENVSVFSESFARLSELTQKFQESIAQSKQFAGEIRRLVSAVTRFEKKMQKRPRRRATGRNVESGITRPVQVSDELCSFLNKPKGTLMARTVVTKHITTYIRE